MKAETCGLLAALSFLLCACDTGVNAPIETGGAAGAMGEAYCDSPPAAPEAMEAWQSRCLPDGGGL